MKKTNKETEIVSEGKLNEVVILQHQRQNKTIRYALDFQYCPTMTEQHTIRDTDINYLMEKYKPDELAAYIAARNQHRNEILGHDFSLEPNLQEAKNVHYALKQAFERLPEELKRNFKSHVEFLKFIDNPENQEKMKKLGLMTEREIAANTTTPTTTQEEDGKKSSPQSSQTSKET